MAVTSSERLFPTSGCLVGAAMDTAYVFWHRRKEFPRELLDGRLCVFFHNARRFSEERLYQVILPAEGAATPATVPFLTV